MAAGKASGVAGLALKAAFFGVAAAGAFALYGDFTGQSGMEVAGGLWEAGTEMASNLG